MLAGEERQSIDQNVSTDPGEDGTLVEVNGQAPVARAAQLEAERRGRIDERMTAGTIG